MKHQIGVDGVARTVVKKHIGVDGVARNVVKGYVGVDGVARQFFQGGVRWNKYDFTPYTIDTTLSPPGTTYTFYNVICSETYSLSSEDHGAKLTGATIEKNYRDNDAASYKDWYHIYTKYNAEEHTLTKTVYQVGEVKTVTGGGTHFHSVKNAVATGYLDTEKEPIGVVYAPAGQLPAGELIYGSVEEGFCVLKQEDEYYYYILKEE